MDGVEWNLPHNLAAGTPTCKEDDHDDDGDLRGNDCDDDDPDRFHGNFDEFNGEDFDCVVDRPTCIGPDNNNVPASCSGFDLGFDIWAGYQPLNTYCIRAEFIDGGDIDPFANASFRIEVKRRKTHVNNQGEYHYPGYSNTSWNSAPGLDVDDMQCGPNAGGGTINSTVDVANFPFGEEPPFICDFPIRNTNNDHLNTTNYTRLVQNPMTPLKYTLEIKHAKIHSNHWHYGESFSRSCEFGD
jgi:hypothetical protein